MDKFFLTQVKRNNNTITKGVVVKDTLDAAKQSYHAYLGAFAYGQEAGTDYVMVAITNSRGLGLMSEFWPEEEVQNDNTEL